MNALAPTDQLIPKRMETEKVDKFGDLTKLVPPKWTFALVHLALVENSKIKTIKMSGNMPMNYRPPFAPRPPPTR